MNLENQSLTCKNNIEQLENRSLHEVVFNQHIETIKKSVIQYANNLTTYRTLINDENYFSTNVKNCIKNCLYIVDKLCEKNRFFPHKKKQKIAFKKNSFKIIFDALSNQFLADTEVCLKLAENLSDHEYLKLAYIYYSYFKIDDLLARRYKCPLDKSITDKAQIISLILN
ncbi:MAG: hypothetical protein WDZ41_01010 [Candidatus Babeliales bacterium]